MERPVNTMSTEMESPSWTWRHTPVIPAREADIGGLPHVTNRLGYSARLIQAKEMASPSLDLELTTVPDTLAGILPVRVAFPQPPHRECL